MSGQFHDVDGLSSARWYGKPHEGLCGNPQPFVNGACPTCGWNGNPAAELDRIAVEEAGVLWAGGYGYAMPVATPVVDFAPEWGTRVINRQGMGNHGRIVLVGLTPRTRALIRQGKTRRLTKDGVPEDVASVAVSMPYGMETEVAMLAAEVVEAVKTRGPFRGGSHREFNGWLDCESDHAKVLSFPRKSAAAAIAAAVIQRSAK